MTEPFPPHASARLEQAHTRLDDLTVRVGRLETADAVSAERDKHIQSSLQKIESNLSRVVWLIVTAIVGGVLTFVVQGGLFRGQ